MAMGGTLVLMALLVFQAAIGPSYDTPGNQAYDASHTLN